MLCSGNESLDICRSLLVQFLKSCKLGGPPYSRFFWACFCLLSCLYTKGSFGRLIKTTYYKATFFDFCIYSLIDRAFLGFTTINVMYNFPLIINQHGVLLR